MGTITIKVPQDIHVEYQIDRFDLTEDIIEKLKEIKLEPSTTAPDRLLGLFAEEAELLDQITESAMQGRENNSLRVS
jgi:hypothetical protein